MGFDHSPLFSSGPTISSEEGTAITSDSPPLPLGCREEENIYTSDSPPLLLSSREEEKVNTSDSPLLPLGRDPDTVGAGLQNDGTTCYLNSVLQCIIHTVPLVEKLSSYHYHPYNGDENYFCSICAFTNLVKGSMDMSGSSLAPTEFTNNLRKIAPDFCLGEQQDAHEFLLCLLDSFHNCCLEPSFRDQPSSMDKDSIVKHVFGGRSVSQLCCSRCGHCSNSYEPLLGLSLEITDADTLIDALQSFTKVEKIEETKFACDGCESQALMWKQTKIDIAPTVLFLHLKRFRNGGYYTHKIHNFIEYPLELNLRSFISCPKDEEQTVYELYGVLIHRGSASYGHYFCFIRSSPTIWHGMDDSLVCQVSQNEALNERAYILFYVKRGSSSWFSSSMEAHNEKHTSPTSVLDCSDANPPSSSAEESSRTSSTGETLSEVEPSPRCNDVPSECTVDGSDHSLSSLSECDGASPQRAPRDDLVRRCQGQYLEGPDTDQAVISNASSHPEEAKRSLLISKPQPIKKPRRRM